MGECEVCGEDFCKDDLTFYEGQVMCWNCRDDVMKENGIVTDI